MHNRLFILCFSILSFAGTLYTQNGPEHFFTADSVEVYIDKGPSFSPEKKTQLVIYALPNGNTIDQTRGKRLQEGDDWHFDIQHIEAQMSFVRQEDPSQNWVIAYFANRLHSWPAWKQAHPAFRSRIPQLIDSVRGMFPHCILSLVSHSGGGSFVFGYLASIPRIPAAIHRIAFIDSDYGYDSSYYPMIHNWLKGGKRHQLLVFAYNDSIVIYNNKPLVSPTGGTWYRSHRFLHNLEADYRFRYQGTDSLHIIHSRNNQVHFFLKENPAGLIYHTVQVELNGFIHALLCATRFDGDGYTYFGARAYQLFIH